MNEAAERPLSVDVELSSGKVVTVGSLDWNGYRKFKPKMVELLAKKTMGMFEDPLVSAGGPAAITPVMMALDEVMSDMTVDFVTSCVSDKKSLKGVTAPVDWLKLRQAAAEVNDLHAILELEGNAMAASVKTVMEKLGELTPEDNSDGG